MSALVQRRGQPHIWLHRDLETRIVLAESYLGRAILVNNVKSPTGEYLGGWRSYAGLVYLWALWLSGKGSQASNPNSGPRAHSRGVAVDLMFYGADVLAACARAGIQVRGVSGEPWHIQLANYPSYPLIPTNTIPVSNGLGQAITADPTTPLGDNMLIIEDGGPTGKAPSGVYVAFADTGATRLFDTRIPAVSAEFNGNPRGILEGINRGPILRWYTRDIDKAIAFYKSMRG